MGGGVLCLPVFFVFFFLSGTQVHTLIDAYTIVAELYTSVCNISVKKTTLFFEFVAFLSN